METMQKKVVQGVDVTVGTHAAVQVGLANNF